MRLILSVLVFSMLANVSSSDAFDCMIQESVGFGPDETKRWAAEIEQKDKMNSFFALRPPSQADKDKLKGDLKYLFGKDAYPYVVVNSSVDMVMIGCENGFNSNGFIVCEEGKMGLSFIFNVNTLRFQYRTPIQYIFGDENAEGFSIGICQRSS